MKKMILSLVIVLISVITTGVAQKNYILSDSVYVLSKKVKNLDIINRVVDDDEIQMMLNNPGVNIRCKVFDVDLVFYNPSTWGFTKEVYASKTFGKYLPKKGIFFSFSPWKYREISWELIGFGIFIFLSSLITVLYQKKVFQIKGLRVWWVINGTIILLIAGCAFKFGYWRLLWSSLAFLTGALFTWGLIKEFIDTPTDNAFASKLITFLGAFFLSIGTIILTRYFLTGVTMFVFYLLIYSVIKYSAELMKKLKSRRKDPKLTLSPA
jgi:hypothetical protein